jgi:hypothetical protein
MAERKRHLSQSPTGKSGDGSDLQIAEAGKWTPVSRSIAQATAYTRMLSPYCGCVVTLRHAEKQHLVCLEVAGELTTTTTYHGR